MVDMGEAPGTIDLLSAVAKELAVRGDRTTTEDEEDTLYASEASSLMSSNNSSSRNLSTLNEEGDYFPATSFFRYTCNEDWILEPAAADINNVQLQPLQQQHPHHEIAEDIHEQQPEYSQFNKVAIWATAASDPLSVLIDDQQTTLPPSAYDVFLIYTHGAAEPQSCENVAILETILRSSRPESSGNASETTRKRTNSSSTCASSSRFPTPTTTTTTPSLKCFFGDDDDVNYHQKVNALDRCRHAVAIVSKTFLTSRGPCAELQYAFQRMKWIHAQPFESQQQQQERDPPHTSGTSWDSLWIVLYDLTLQEYMLARKNSEFDLPDITQANRLLTWSSRPSSSSGTGSLVSRVRKLHKMSNKADTWPALCARLKAEIVKHDQERAAVAWRWFLENPSPLDA